jgi:uncharacterized protein (TIRG00374 family)
LLVTDFPKTKPDFQVFSSENGETTTVKKDENTFFPGKLALVKHIIVAVIISSLLFLGLAAYGDFRQVWANLQSFPLRSWLTALGLALVNYFLRALRWHYYLRCLGLKRNLAFSLMTFMAGLALTVSPGKVGELVKSYLLKHAARVPFVRSLPVLLAERGTDALALLILAIAFGAARWSSSFDLIGILMVAPVLVFTLIKGAGVWHRLIEIIKHLPYGERFAAALAGGYASMRDMFRGSTLLIATALATMAWFAECYALFLVARAAGMVEIGVTQAALYYSLATLAGAVSMAPGGLGATEAALSAMLVTSGIPSHLAVATTLIIRVCTLWFAVPVGISFLVLTSWLLSRRGATEEGSGWGT